MPKLQHLTLALALIVSPALAQPALPMAMPSNMAREVLPIPREPNAIPLNTGAVPGMPPEAWERFMGNVSVRNVSRATLTPFLPRRGRETGAAVIVLPGGGFYGLAVASEGSAVAQFLADRGIAAFVLKYRLNPTPAKAEDQLAFITARMVAASPTGGLKFPTPPQSLEDAQAALRLVRDRAAEWRVDSDRVGMVGFSAGAILTLSTTLASAPDKPDFVGLIYPPMDAVEVPAAAPPAFMAIAADDPLFGNKGYGLAESWRRARRPVELHAYQQGGHGFGLGAAGNTASNWGPGFFDWMRMNRLLEKK